MPRSNLVSFGWIFGAVALIGGCAHPSPPPAAMGCPIAERGEVESDCPWAQWTRELTDEKAAPVHLPEVIASSLALDAQDSALHEAWGQSLYFDSGARAEIVARPVLESLAKTFRTHLTEQDGITHQHAGLIHTYGYLLSNLQTPFGYKRARWVSGAVDRGLALPAQTLGPVIQGSSTLLSRATYLFMKVALHQDARAWKKWEKRLSARATPELRALRLSRISRKTESFEPKKGKKLELVTDLVPLEKDPQGGRLLVYSVRRGGRFQIITGFPVDAKFEEKPGNPVRPRYNAWVE